MNENLAQSKPLLPHFAIAVGTILAFPYAMSVLLTFYRNFVFACSGVSLINCLYVYQSGTALFIVKTLWLKLFTSVFIGLYFHFFHRSELVFFNNLGYSTARLYAVAAMIDIGTWLLMASLTLLVI